MSDNPYWNTYVPGPTSGTAWNQGYLRLGAKDASIENTTTLTAAKSSDFSSGILIYTTGKIAQRGLTSSVTTFGGDSYSAVTNGNQLYSASYSYDQGNNYNRTVKVTHGGQFNLTVGDAESINLSNKMDLYIGNNSSMSVPLKFEEIFGFSVKYAPIEVSLSTTKIELKGGFWPGVIETSASLRGFKGVTLAVNPVTDGLMVGGAVTAYNTTMTTINGTFAALSAAFASAIALQGIFAFGDGSESEMKNQMKVLNIQFIAFWVLWSVAEAVALVLAAVALVKRAADWVGDYPAFPTIKLTPTGIQMAAGATTWLDLNAFGLTLNGPSITTLGPMQSAIPLVAPPVPIPN